MKITHIFVIYKKASNEEAVNKPWETYTDIKEIIYNTVPFKYEERKTNKMQQLDVY